MIEELIGRKEAWLHFAETLSKVQSHPVVITNQGKPDVVIIPFSEYQRIARKLLKST